MAAPIFWEVPFGLTHVTVFQDVVVASLLLVFWKAPIFWEAPFGLKYVFSFRDVAALIFREAPFGLTHGSVSSIRGSSNCVFPDMAAPIFGKRLSV